MHGCLTTVTTVTTTGGLTSGRRRGQRRGGARSALGSAHGARCNGGASVMGGRQRQGATMTVGASTSSSSSSSSSSASCVLARRARGRSGARALVGAAAAGEANGETAAASGASGASGAASSGKPAKESDGDASLDLPLQSASARKRVGRTRLLRTPMAGGVVSRDTKDSKLPSMATAARNLMEIADYGDLSTTMSDMHHRRAGYPFGSTVDFATDATGHPIFCLAPLAIHTRNIAADGRCSLTVKMSGWGGLANARVTIFGDVERLPQGEYQQAANEIFKAKYHARKEAIDMEDRWGDYTFYRMNRLVDVYFVGGFGSLNWIKLDEYRNTSPDKIVTAQRGRSVTETLGELNARFSRALAAHMSEVLDTDVDDLWIISIDRCGIDVRVRTDGSSLIRRITFDCDVECFDDADRALSCALQNNEICSSEFA